MHPVLVRIPMPGWDLPLVGQLTAIPIYSYGLMLGLSLLAGWYLTLGLARRDGLPREIMANTFVLTAALAFLGARLLFFATSPDKISSVAGFFAFSSGGMVAYGGFLGGLLASKIYLSMKKVPLLPWADIAAPSLAAGLAITRVGCYLFGCDFGKPLTQDAPSWLQALGRFPKWAEGTMPSGAGSPPWLEHVNSHGLSPTAPYSLPVHPTQIYEMLVGVALLALLLLVRRRQRFRGQVFLVGAFAYGVCRFCIELLRDDPDRGTVFGPMARHLLVPGAMVFFALAFALSVATLIEGRAARRAAQVVGFLPAVWLALYMTPKAGMARELLQLSTSQFIALASALLVCAAYFVLDKAAQAHPAAAMAIDLSGLDDDAQPSDDAGSADSGEPDEHADADLAEENDDEEPSGRGVDSEADAGLKRSDEPSDEA